MQCPPRTPRLLDLQVYASIAAHMLSGPLFSNRKVDKTQKTAATTFYVSVQACHCGWCTRHELPMMKLLRATKLRTWNMGTMQRYMKGSDGTKYSSHQVLGTTSVWSYLGMGMHVVCISVAFTGVVLLGTACTLLSLYTNYSQTDQYRHQDSGVQLACRMWQFTDKHSLPSSAGVLILRHKKIATKQSLHSTISYACQCKSMVRSLFGEYRILRTHLSITKKQSLVTLQRAWGNNVLG